MVVTIKIRRLTATITNIQTIKIIDMLTKKLPKRKLTFWELLISDKFRNNIVKQYPLTSYHINCVI